MKKAFLVTTAVLLALSLSACGSKSGDGNSHKDTVTVAATGKKYTTKSSFKNGVYKTKKYILTITKEEVVKDKQQGDTGLIVWYTVKNIGKDSNVTGSDSIANLNLSQSDGSSISDLQDGYDAEEALYPNPSTNAQIDQSNKMTDVDNASKNKVLPGKTVQSFDAYTLNNTTHDVTVTATDPTTLQKVGMMTIKIK